MLRAASQKARVTAGLLTTNGSSSRIITRTGVLTASTTASTSSTAGVRPPRASSRTSSIRSAPPCSAATASSTVHAITSSNGVGPCSWSWRHYGRELQLIRREPIAARPPTHSRHALLTGRRIRPAYSAHGRGRRRCLPARQSAWSSACRPHARRASTMRARIGASPPCAVCNAAVNLWLCAGTTRSSWSAVVTRVAG